MRRTSRPIDALVRRYAPEAGRHLSDQRLADLFCRDLSWVASWLTRRHLARCSSCRNRRDELERPCAEAMLRFYRESIDSEPGVPSDRRRAQFARWLDLEWQHAELRHRSVAERPKGTPPLALPSRFAFFHPAAYGAVALGLLIAVAGLLFLRSQRSVPVLSADTLLLGAGKWDAAGAASAPGVVRQTIRIQTPKETVERSVYWDRQGKRQPARPPSSQNAWLGSALGQAGVDWARPLSASAYQAWRTHQPSRSDRVSRSPHLLTLTTTVADGDVSAESLTVRDTDLHPVARTVDFRDQEKIEIAEVDFTVLPWSSVQADLFEPVGGVSAPVHATTSDTPALHLPAAPTADQLDETELLARLLLNQLQADTGEQIQVHRYPHLVEVEGLVEQDARRRELSTRLATVPGLKVSLQSATDLRAAHAADGQVVSVESTSLPDHPSALESCLRSRGRTLEESNVLAQQLFSGALTISQESNAIVDLQARFEPEARTGEAAAIARPMSLVKSVALAELLYNHRERLGVAMRRERLLLGLLSQAPLPSSGASAPGIGELRELAAKNLALARELTETNTPAARNADLIFAEMADSLDDLAIAAHRRPGNAQQQTARAGKE